MGCEERMALTSRTQWKEELHITDEQGRTFVFYCGWGVEPPVAYIPDPVQWTQCVPAWLRPRRDEVIAAMWAQQHDVLEGPYPVMRSL
jgi:hypothetical protein